MPKANTNEYDAVIIGAGISGLVCGCYLAKAGMKVLIAEQHFKPGGYCTSFKRQGFTFNAAAHSLGGFKYGNIGKIFEDLGLDRKIKIGKSDPSNIVITPDYRISFWADVGNTIKEFQSAFPGEKNNIKDFFSFIAMPDTKSSAGMKSMTFRNLLDGFFFDHRLKAILSFPLFGNSGCSPSLMSAFIGTKIFREFLLDGGYYLEGGMQALPDTLAEIFGESGGDLRLSCRVKKISVEKNMIMGVVLEDGGFLPTKYVISNCDARQTFLKLLGTRAIGQEFSKTIRSMIPSLSAFILYLGMEESFQNLYQTGINLWVLSHYDLDALYLAVNQGHLDDIGGYLVHFSPDEKSVLAFMSAPFKDKNYWSKNKKKLSDTFLKRIAADVIPNLSKYIQYMDASTPYTLYRYTLNYKGAAFGWACIPSQFAITDFRKSSIIQHFYLTGHWTTKGLGIPGVVYIGYDTAKTILRKESLPVGQIVL